MLKKKRLQLSHKLMFPLIDGLYVTSLILNIGEKTIAMNLEIREHTKSKRASEKRGFTGKYVFSVQKGKHGEKELKEFAKKISEHTCIDYREFFREEFSKEILKANSAFLKHLLINFLVKNSEDYVQIEEEFQKILKIMQGDQKN